MAVSLGHGVPAEVWLRPAAQRPRTRGLSGREALVLGQVDRQERRHEAWQQRLEEAKQSLRGAQHVGDDLERLKPSLNSEPGA